MADGSKQRTYDGYDKSDVSLPNFSTDSIFITGVVDAHENRAIAILYIANAFLHAENDKNIIMLLCSKLADMMVQVDQIMYHKYVTYSPDGKDMLYIRLSKSIYGMIRAALFFYKI